MSLEESGSSSDSSVSDEIKQTIESITNSCPAHDETNREASVDPVSVNNHETAPDTRNNPHSNPPRWLPIANFIVQILLFAATALAFGAAAYYATVASEQKETMDRQWKTMHYTWLESLKQTAAAALSASGSIVSADAAKRAVTVANQSLKIGQRPWIQIEFGHNGPDSDPSNPQTQLTLASGQPISVPIRIRNTGKTPAQNIRADFLVQISGIDDPMMFPPMPIRIKNLSASKGGAIAAFNHIETGIIFVDQFSPANVIRADGYTLAALPLTFDEGMSLARGNAMVYVNGLIRYNDGFGTEHWTMFCKALTDAPMNRRCAKYNAVDSNNN